jgi:hypothetical protein
MLFEYVETLYNVHEVEEAMKRWVLEHNVIVAKHLKQKLDLFDREQSIEVLHFQWTWHPFFWVYLDNSIPKEHMPSLPFSLRNKKPLPNGQPPWTPILN